MTSFLTRRALALLPRSRRRLLSGCASLQHHCNENNDVARLEVLAYADGASRGNPGRSGCGALLLDVYTREVLASDMLYVGDQETNNAAEYHGLLLALRLARDHGAERVHVLMDSQLVVRQMQGQYRVKAAKLQRLHQQCQELSAALGGVTFEHVARAENAAADRLANEAIDQHEAVDA